MPRGRSNSARGGNTVEKEVAALFALGSKADQTVLLRLRHKYGDDALVDAIQREFVMRHAKVVRAAKKFAQAVRNKYAHTNTPYHMLLQKARLHARKYKMSAAEFAEFQRMYEQELAGTNRKNEVVVPVTNMMKVLGNLAENKDDAGFAMRDGDYKNLQEILRLEAESRQLHSQVVLQTLTYGDGMNTGAGAGAANRGPQFSPIGPQALAVAFDKNLENQTDHVHPVLVAMFLRANEELDNHFLLSNVAGIVKARYNKDALTTRADYELFYDMVTDPNDIVCDNRSPLADLLHRSNLQQQLWNCVLNMRNGRCYNESFRNFMAQVDVCRLNKYDNPDFVYGRHDGTIAKRLLSAFSYRPTVVSTRPVQSVVMANNPYSVNVRPTVTRIPMITFRVGQNGGAALNVANELTTAQSQYFIEGNVVVQRSVEILYSRGNVMIYLDRRLNHINLNDYPSMTYSQVPLGVAGFERINDKDVTIASDANITIGQGGSGNEDQFFLSGAVCAKVQAGVKKSRTQTVDVVVGSEAFVSLRNVDMRNAKGLASGPRNMPAPPPVPAVGAVGGPGNLPQPAQAAFNVPAGAPYGANSANSSFVKYDPMRTSPVNNQVNPYESASSNTVNDAVKSRGLLLMYTAVELDENRDVSHR